MIPLKEIINSLRVFATVLLVAYPVIGVDAAGGMRVGDGSGWRFAADLLVDLRMPLFAFVAGLVYALGPISTGHPTGFAVGEFRRLVVPGVVAAAFFRVLGNTVFRNALSSGTTLVESVLLSTGHYWFLLAILLIFMVVGPLNALPRHRAAFALSSGCVALSLIWGRLTLPADGLLRISNAVYLAPSFLLGVIANREGATLLTRNGPVLAGAACLMGYGLYLNLGTYAETGRLSLGRMDAQSLGVGIGAILLVSCLVPKRRLPDRLAVCAFTVYLCHPIGTSGARRLFDAIGEEAGFVRFALGTAAGFGVPTPIHRIEARMDWSRRALPGLRAKRQGALVAT